LEKINQKNKINRKGVTCQGRTCDLLVNLVNVKEALKHESWVQAMKDELEQFDINKFMTLVEFPQGVYVIGMK
jgi:hypothetical protein